MKRKRRPSEAQQAQSKPGVEDKHDTTELKDKTISNFQPSSKEHHSIKKAKTNFARVQIDPARKYTTPECRESWGPNVKGKKFRKEKGKKKRCPNAGVRIDGSVKSIRLDA